MPESQNAETTLYYAPRTRSFTALWLLEELNIPYRLESFDLATRRHKADDFIELNPMGKVPVVVHDGVAVSELGAIAIYMADLFPEAGLAPALDDPKRAEFLRWCFFSSAIIEPALGEVFFKWDVPASSVAWGSFNHMLTTLEAGVSGGGFLLGDQFSAADVLVGASARFGQMFGAIKSDVVADYIARLTAREACKRAAAIELREGERFPPAG